MGPPNAPSDVLSVVSPTWLVGGGEVIELIRAKDWSTTPLGPLSDWPESLRSTVSLILASSFPLNLIWGDGAVQIWNDAYAGFCGDKHPVMFGSDYRECWASAWPAIGEAFDAARAGSTVFLEDQPMFLDRKGYLEETWFTMSLSPIRDNMGEIAGLLLPVTETSARMLSERRTRALRDLSTGASGARSTSEAIACIAEVLEKTSLDVPLALLYLRDQDNTHARLRGQAGVHVGAAISQRELPLDGDSPVALALRDDTTVMVDDITARYGPVHAGAYGEPLQRAMVVPITPLGAGRPTGAMFLGVSTRLELDDIYYGFLDLVARNVTGSLTSANAHEQERARADGLAELDRAKTTFMTNISHEFRTPLTLMLGPLEDELAERSLSPTRRERLSMVHRNGLRLLRLVNSLLDFSRTESGRVQPKFQATNLAAFTAELAGLFRYTIEAAGLDFKVDCDSLPEPAFVDREMWERIVMNLLSNAFKHTFEGGISLGLRRRGDQVELEVRDTGVGIPADALPHLFERFRRVSDTPSRTIEGTGIGLALIQELAHRHGGEVTVESEQGSGSSFVVTIPGGRAHIPAELVTDGGQSATASGLAASQVEEAAGWITLGDGATDVDDVADHPVRARGGFRPRILVVDDNADMRRHLVQMLEPVYEIVTAPDGALALEAALASPPDLVLTDVMMPLLDGFGLLAALREDPRTSTTPVIMLSARAGEEAAVDGIRAGVDDYLAKPFTAQELIVRISRSLELARIRRESEQRLEGTNRELTDALDQLESLARTDPGTGLPNRRAWEAELTREVSRASRTSNPLCVAMLDVDHLKVHNDTYGHQAGDTLLREAGTAWRVALRVTDVVARIGGDEFALLLPDCALAQAGQVLERVIAATPYEQTCSAGLVCWDGSETPDALVGRADAALYHAKQTGRARVTVRHSGPAPTQRGQQGVAP